MTFGRIRRRALHSENGAAAVEFAIVAVLLLIMVMGIIDFGRLLFVQQAVKSASREAARVASVEKTNTQIYTAAKNAASTAVALAAGGPATVKLETCADATSACPTWLTADPAFSTSDGTTGITGASIPCSTAGITTVRLTVVAQFKWLTPLGKLPGLGNFNANRNVSGQTVMSCE